MTSRRHGIGIFAGIALLGAASSAFAADLRGAPPLVPVVPVPAPEETWVVGVHSYAWATSVDGRFRTLPPGQAVKVHLGFADILDDLDGALMVSLDARRGRFVVFSDVMVSRLSAGKTFTAQGYPGSVSLASSSVVGLATAGYRIVDEPALAVDLLGGVRGFALSNTIAVAVAPFGLSYGKDRQWVDAVAGARVTHAFGDRLSVTAMGFVGTGGARYEWDLFGGVGYRFGERIGGFAGYRAFKVDYERGSYVYDALQYGPVVGMRVSF